MSRAKNLSDEDVAKIVEVLDGWSGTLRWELLIDAVERRLFARYTRQALNNHKRIKAAFSNRKNELARSGNSPKTSVFSPELQLALDRNDRLSFENTRLKKENTGLLEQFVRWAYNAHLRGLDEEFLNRPLPRVNRGQTKVRKIRLATVKVLKDG